MKKLFVLIQLLILSGSPVFGQSSFSRINEQELLAIRNRVWIRNPTSGKFEPLKNHLPYVIPPSADRRSGAAWDGEYLYLVEPTVGKSIQARFAFNLNSVEGPHWFWHEPVILLGNFRCLATYNRSMLLQQEGEKNAHNVPVSRLVLWDLEEGSTKLLLERENPHKTLFASAILNDRDFIIMLNDGYIFQLDEGASMLRELKSNFWSELSALYIHIETGPKGEIIYLPPHFRSGPFFDASGNVYFALQVREKNHWNSKALSAFWEDLKPADREWAVAHGKWPTKEDGFDGSDDVAVILKFDTEKKLTKVPESEFKSFIEQDKYTHQWRWSVELGFSSIALDRQGHFVTLESLLADPKEQPTQPRNKPTLDKKATPEIPVTLEKPVAKAKVIPTK